MVLNGPTSQIQFRLGPIFMPNQIRPVWWAWPKIKPNSYSPWNSQQSLSNNREIIVTKIILKIKKFLESNLNTIHPSSIKFCIYSHRLHPPLSFSSLNTHSPFPSVKSILVLNPQVTVIFCYSTDTKGVCHWQGH